MKKRDVRLFLLDVLRENIRGAIIADSLKQKLEDYSIRYRERHNAPLTNELKERFLSLPQIRGKARAEADEIIEEYVDNFLAEKFKWLPFHNLAITGVLILPAMISLGAYGIMHFLSLLGHGNRFEDLGVIGFAGVLVSFLELFAVIIASCVDELRKE